MEAGECIEITDKKADWRTLLCAVQTNSCFTFTHIYNKFPIKKYFAFKNVSQFINMFFEAWYCDESKNICIRSVQTDHENIHISAKIKILCMRCLTAANQLGWEGKG